MTAPSSIKLTPIATVRNTRTEIKDDNWGNVISEIVLDERFPESAFSELDTFSHVEVIFHFDQVPEEKINTSSRRPRNNPDWPEVGIFAQRGKNRPNRIGLCTATVQKVEGRVLTVQGLDAIDGTPVLDIKPVMKEFLPKGSIKQPGWSSELMGGYW